MKIDHILFVIVPIIVICAFLYAYHLIKWTYADATSRGMKPAFWTIIALGSQNSAGILLYLWKRTKRLEEASPAIRYHKQKAIHAVILLLIMTVLLFILLLYYEL